VGNNKSTNRPKRANSRAHKKTRGNSAAPDTFFSKWPRRKKTNNLRGILFSCSQRNSRVLLFVREIELPGMGMIELQWGEESMSE
jgi:hypothetical protein